MVISVTEVQAKIQRLLFHTAVNCMYICVRFLQEKKNRLKHLFFCLFFFLYDCKVVWKSSTGAVNST